MAVALLALFVALGGSGYAALKLPKNSVGSAQLKTNSVTSSKVKDKSLRAGDFKPGALPAGARGPVGPQGPPGPASGPAGGDLTGSFPDPAIRQDAVDGSKVRDNSLSGSDVDESTLNVGGSMHEVGTAGEPGFPLSQACDPPFCKWQNYAPGWETVGFFRDRAGVVHLKGLACVAGGGGSACTSETALHCYLGPSTAECPDTIFTLPSGYRPSLQEIFPTLVGVNWANSLGRIDVTAAGAVELADAPGGASAQITWVSLNGITFRCAPAGASGCP